MKTKELYSAILELSRFITYIRTSNYANSKGYTKCDNEIDNKVLFFC